MPSIVMGAPSGRQLALFGHAPVPPALPTQGTLHTALPLPDWTAQKLVAQSASLVQAP